MVKEKSLNTEERILNAAIKIFSEKGFSAATTSEIAKEANVAEGTIFRYFPKKKELLHGIVLRVIDIFGKNVFIDELQQVIDENTNKTSKEIIKAMIMNRIKIFYEHFPYVKILLYEIQFHEDVREVFIDKIAKRAIKIAKQVIEAGKEKGEIRDIDSFVICRSFIGMVLMMLMQRQFIPSENAFDDVKEEVDIIIDIFFNGIKAQ